MLKFRFEKKPNLFRLNWWSSAKTEWAPKLLLDNKEKWPLEVNPDGQPWKSLSPSYAKWKSKNYGSLPILRLSGNMQDSAHINIRGNKFIVSTTEEGVYHQFGTDKIPARPWMGVPKKSLDRLAEISLEHILKP